jgi:hypothetical protein
LEIAHDTAQASSESNKTLINGKKPIDLVPSYVITPACSITFITFNCITLNYVTLNYVTLNYVAFNDITFVEINCIAPANENWFIVFVITSSAPRCASSQGVAYWCSTPALSLVCRNYGLIVGGIDCLERQCSSREGQQTACLWRRST